MTINGIFFDLYGTLLVYGNMDAAWSDWLNALYAQLKLRGLTLSIESLAKTCDQFYSKSEPTPRQHNLTVFEQRIQNLCFDLKLNLASEDIKVIANKVANAWQAHMSLDSETHHVLHTLHRFKKLALVSNFDHPPHVHSVLSKLDLTPYFDSVVISAEVGVKKPDPRIFDRALEQTAMKPEEVIYVGDTDDDTEAARAAGMVSVLIQRNYVGNAFDFSTNKHNSEQEEFTPNVTTVTKLSEILTLFESYATKFQTVGKL